MKKTTSNTMKRLVDKMKKDSMMERTLDILTSADMAKDWLNRNNVKKSENIYQELDSILKATESLREELIKIMVQEVLTDEI